MRKTVMLMNALAAIFVAIVATAQAQNAPGAGCVDGEIVLISAGSAEAALAADARDPIITLIADGREMTLSAAQLGALPQYAMATANEFVDGITCFWGPLARDVAAMNDMDADSVAFLTAANDYSIDIAVSEFLDYEVLFATAMDGQVLSMRDKGPIWVVYPMSTYAELGDPIYNNRLIWQLVRMEKK